MKIRFRNVGSIKSLDFELKRGLTLLCGPNSTGKTYAAYVIFSILTRLGETPAQWLTAQDIASLREHGDLSLDWQKVIASDGFLQDISQKLAQHLAGDFDAPKDFFAKNSVCLESLMPQHPAPMHGSDWSRQFTLGNTLVILGWNQEELAIVMTSLVDSEPMVLPSTETLLAAINTHISYLFSAKYFGSAVVLSAERAAINLFSRELSASRHNLVDQLLAMDVASAKPADFNMAQFIGQKAARYSLPIRKGLATAEDLKNIAKKPGEYADFASKLEQLVLGGKIGIGEFGELIYSQNDAGNLRINLAASMVKALASLVVYLRYQAVNGDLLIIDEPELNLHPDSQRKITRFLCELTNAGLDILISTHSDYIVREVNNAILLMHPSMQNVKAKHAYQDAQLLAPEKVSVVLFNTTGHPKQLVVDHKGFAVDSIDEEINSLNQIAEDIEQDWQE